MTQINITRDELLDMLKSGIVDIEFRKADGSLRPMLATQNADHMPDSAIGYDGNRDNNHPDRVNVWDVRAQGWRSFKFSSLTREPRPITRAEASAVCSDQPEHHDERTADAGTESAKN